MNLQFERDYCFLDLETTGVSPVTDKIISICVVKFSKDKHNIFTDPLFEDDYTEKTHLINPVFPIPAAATAVHGITDEMVKDKPTFRQISKALHDFIAGCDIIGYNSISFDVPLLYNEFIRSEITWDYQAINFIDACNIFKIKEPRTLEAAFKFYTGYDMQDAHDASKDVWGTIEVIKAQINKYPELKELSIAELAKFSNYDKPILDISGKFTTNEAGEIVFNFGQHKGKKAINEKSYLDWIIKTPDFSEDTKIIARKLRYS